MSDNPIPALTIDLKDNGGAVIFEEPTQARTWLERERAFLTSLSSKDHTGEIPNTFGNANQSLHQINNAIERWAPNPADQNMRNAVSSEIAKRFGSTAPRDEKLIHSTSRRGQIVTEIAQSNGVYAGAGALHVLLQGRLPEREPHLTGAFLALLAMAGVTTTSVAATQKTLGEMLGSYSSKLVEHQAKAEALEAKMEASCDQHQSRIDEFESAAGKERISAQMKHEAAMGERETAWDQFQERIRKKLSLQAPVLYWRRKHTEHARYFWVCFASFLLYVAGTGFLGWHLTTADKLFELDTWKNLQSVQLGFAVFIALVVGIVVAIGRVFLRFSLSQLHLANDAKERVTMVETYLALHEGQNVDPKLLEIVLQRLFAPATDGVVKDDISPFIWAEVFKPTSK